jgi:hypothetical protein
MNKPTNTLLSILAVGATTLIAGSAYGQVLYSDSTTPTGGLFANSGDWEVGNEVLLNSAPGSSDLITDLKFQFDATGSTLANLTGNETVQLVLYKNDGSPVPPSGALAPSTVLFQSAAYTLSQLGITATTFSSVPQEQGITLDFQQSDLGGGVTVPEDFTWAVKFGDVAANESFGLSTYAPPTVGANYMDAWVNTGSGWNLDVANAGLPSLEFGAIISTSSVPDNASTLMLLGSAITGLVGISKLNRRSVRA